MNILVTGGAGFIGSHLVDKFLDIGNKVTVIDSSAENIVKNLKPSDNLVIHHMDVRSDRLYNIMEAEKIEMVVHAAALADIVPSIEDPIKYHETNVNGTVAVLEASKKRGVKKFVYIASGSCYGDSPPVPTKECHPIKPQYPYALTKWMGEEWAMHYHKVYGLPVISLRFFNIYGPRSRTNGVYGALFGTFLAQKLAGKPFTVVGSGEQTRDFLFVSDAVDAIVGALKSEWPGQVYNIGSGQGVSINRICQLLGPNEVVKLPKRPGEPQHTCAKFSRANKDLNFKPKVGIEEGCKIMLENIDYWKDAPVWTKESIDEATKKWFHYLGREKNASELHRTLN